MTGAPVRVAVAGATGEMGRYLMAGLPNEPEIEVVGGFSGRDLAEADRLLAQADVMVEFTHADAAPGLVLRAIDAGVRPISGSSGLSEEILGRFDAAARARGIGAVWASPFRIGGALMIHFARVAARYMDAVEILDVHRPTSQGAPTGMAVALAYAIREGRGSNAAPAVDDEQQIVAGTRGAIEGGVRIHSARLPGAVTRHDVMFGAKDELLTIRHEGTSREDVASNVARAIRRVMQPDCVGLLRGFDAVLGLGD